MSNTQRAGRIKAGTFDLDVTTLRQIVAYDEEAGQLVWRRTHGKRISGAAVGTTCSKRGYLRVCIGGAKYALHRLVWLYVHGEWPTDFIDHIDGNTKNNRLGNLREATCAENLWNTRKSKANTSGFKGVCWNSRSKSWRAYVSVNGKQHTIGYFKSKEDAFAARVHAANRMHGEFARHA